MLYDGSPAEPDMGVLWDLADEAGVTCFGTSACYIAACMKEGVEPGSRPRPDARCARSARPARRSRPRASSGSTTTSAPTPGCSRPPAAPTSAPRSSAAYPPCPSTAASCRGARSAPRCEAWDEDGESVIDEVGELVITEPMPSMPVFFWGDPDGSRYRESYFEMFPGDLAPRRLDRDHRSRGTAIIYGRSDSTINRSGIRMGTSEIYRAVASVDEVTDALVVDIPRPGTEGWMPLFVVLARRRRARRRADEGDREADPRALLAPPRARSRLPDRRGPADAERQGARGAG